MKLFSRRKLELLGIDTLIAVFSYYAMMLLFMLNRSVTVQESGFTVPKLVVFCVCLLGVRALSRCYRCLWRYANVNAYLRLVLSDVLAGALFLLSGMVYKALSLPLTYHFVVSMTTLILTLCSRFLYQRIYAVRGIRMDVRSESAEEQNHRINVVIVGAGNIGAALAESLQRNPKAHYKPYCFVDKDAEKIGNEVNGLRVYADDEKIIDRIKEMPVQEIIVALPDLSPSRKDEIYEKYKKTDCKVKLYDYSMSEPRKANIREFRIEDLLFRDSIRIHNERTARFYSGKVVMVTGGGGSIGSELCRQIAKQRPCKLVIVDIYENNAYDIQQELIREYCNQLNLEVIIASVRDAKRMEDIFAAVRPQIVIHAAAHKHVPLMEHSPCEAIKNNVFGTYNCANLAEKYGAEKFLLISTDKAVNPTNVMGASKRLCEMVIQCRADSKTEFAAVRFGNVLGSNGSVIPLFRKQIEKGGPVTLTDKRIIRYFMTIPEAVQLVLEAGAMAKNGELFVLDMGKPVKILDLAENMIRMEGYIPYQDIDIVEIGLRPGEKLYEELLMKSENLTKTDNDMIFVEHDRPLARAKMEENLKLLRQAGENGTPEAVYQAIRATVPTYKTPEEVNKTAAAAKEMQEAAGAVQAEKQLPESAREVATV